jgi:GR25 family glycosyltransferase involved in LPS biosynthesis
MDAYLINLDDRLDRLQSASTQLAGLGIGYKRVSAVKPENDFNTKYPYVAPQVAAIWLSHLKALSLFLDSKNELCLVLEDDFVFKKPKIGLPVVYNLAKDYDLLQIGFLRTGFLDWLNFKAINIQDLALKFLNRYSKYSLPFSRILNEKFLIYSQDFTSIGVVINDFRAGAHGYLISRKFALEVLEFNDPVLFSADQFFMSLATMKSFRIARLRKSIVGQDSSPSSVSFRFTSQRN